MKKFFILTMVAIVLGLVACSNNQTDNSENETNNESTETNTNENQGAANEKEPLTLQVLKADEEAGATVENHNIYKELNNLVTENPSIGEENDFSLYIVNTIHDQAGEVRLVLLGINRLTSPIKNISFNFTLGNKQGEYVWENQEVTMSEDSAGPLQSNHAFPIILPLTAEQEERLKSLNEENQVMEIENFQYEEA